VLKFPEVEKLSPPILMLSGVSFAYDGNLKNGAVFRDVDLSATMESRICIVGENGAGKMLDLIIFCHDK
jgi:ATP-binding cassette subfamily F protein 3